MPDAKVVIKLSEGLIDIEGPVDFVSTQLKSLEVLLAKIGHAPAPVGDRSSPPLNTNGQKTGGRKSGGKRSGASCASRILALNEGNKYFGKPKSQKEVAEELEKKATPYPANHVAAALNSIVKGGKLRRVKGSDGAWVYVNP